MTTRNKRKETGKRPVRSADQPSPDAPAHAVAEPVEHTPSAPKKAATKKSDHPKPEKARKAAKSQSPRPTLLEALAHAPPSPVKATSLDAAVQAVLHGAPHEKASPARSGAPTPAPHASQAISAETHPSAQDSPGQDRAAAPQPRVEASPEPPRPEAAVTAESSPGSVDAAEFASRQTETEQKARVRARAKKPSERAKAATGVAALPLPDFEALAQNMGALVQQSGQAAAAYAEPRQESAAKQAPSTKEASDAFKALGRVAEHWFMDPARMIQAQVSLTAQVLDLWATSMGRFAGQASAQPDPKAEPRPTDKRFVDPEWSENPVFDFLRKAYLIGSGWANDLVEGADSLDAPTRDKARFYLRQISSALSPSNFVATNPELLRETLEQSGSNLVRGMKMLAEDIKAGRGELKIRQTDTSKFELGVNMALTPGKVVFRNDVMELIQYAPATETVFRRPLLIVPPWINKFYILDLNPEKSFIRWAVSQGLTVFVISWVNPDERHADKDFEAYMREGILAALDAIETATGETDIAAVGYCVGGTLLAITLAYLAARPTDKRISSATLFATQVDFSHAGDLKVFADEPQIRAIEAEMRETGYLQGSKMAQAFNMLRPEDLIWSYVVNNYLKGKDPLPFDLLAWNSDCTRMPAANHSFYLRNCYLENNLTRGRMEIAGQRLDLGKVTIPIYNLATSEDHIAPARSVFEGSRYFGGPVRYVLAGSGHIAGVVNPPARARYGYRDGPEPVGDFDAWLAAATQHPGSWWEDWLAWLTAQAPDKVPARQPGGGTLEILADAPGDYVRVRA